MRCADAGRRALPKKPQHCQRQIKLESSQRPLPKVEVRQTHLMLLALSCLATGASAEFQEFTTHDGWFDAVGGAANVTTIDFTELPLDTTITDQYQDLGVTWSGLNFITPSILDPDERTLRMFNGNDIFFDEPITYFGADIGTGSNTVEYKVYSGDTLLHESQLFGNPPEKDFGGIVSDEPFDRIHVRDPFDNLAIFFDMHFGPPIPAPGALAPLAMLVCVRSRRRRQ